MLKHDMKYENTTETEDGLKLSWGEIMGLSPG